MASNTIKEAVWAAADDGDPVAEQIKRDIAEEEGEDIPAHKPLMPGDWGVWWTVTHAFVGQLAGSNHEEYLIYNVTQIFETGELGKFYTEGVARYCESTPVMHRIRRGSIIDIAEWPTSQPPRQDPQNTTGG